MVLKPTCAHKRGVFLESLLLKVVQIACFQLLTRKCFKICNSNNAKCSVLDKVVVVSYHPFQKKKEKEKNI